MTRIEIAAALSVAADDARALRCRIGELNASLRVLLDELPDDGGFFEDATMALDMAFDDAAMVAGGVLRAGRELDAAVFHQGVRA